MPSSGWSAMIDAGRVHAGVAAAGLRAACAMSMICLTCGSVSYSSRQLRDALDAPCRASMPGTPGMSLVSLSTAASGTPSTRPTSLHAAFAASVPNVMICATWPYFLRTYSMTLRGRPGRCRYRYRASRTAARVHEPLEQQAVLDRVDVAEEQQVARSSCRRPSRARARRGCRCRGRSAEVPDDQEVGQNPILLMTPSSFSSRCTVRRPARDRCLALSDRPCQRNRSLRRVGLRAFRRARHFVAPAGEAAEVELEVRTSRRCASVLSMRCGTFGELLRHFLRALEVELRRRTSCASRR